MGDAWCQHTRPTPHFSISVIKRPFIEWLSGELGSLWTGSISTRYNDEDRSTQYALRTIAHEELERYASWYESGKKAYPDDLKLTPLTAKMWYVCDGTLAWSNTESPRHTPTPSASFACWNERDRLNWLVSLFQEQGFDARARITDKTASIHIPNTETPEFLDWLGAPVPGYGYKFSIDYERNQR